MLLSWENEAYLAINQFGRDKFEIVYPSISVLAEPPVALVDQVADRHGTREVAQAYLKYLYSDEGQRIAAKHYFRPRLASAAKYGPAFPQLKMFTVQEVFGGWRKAQAAHFDDGGVFDQIYQH